MSFQEDLTSFFSGDYVLKSIFLGRHDRSGLVGLGALSRRQKGK
jgi:hypothetical protein